MREAFFPSSVQHYAVETRAPRTTATRSRRSPRATSRADEVALMRAWWDAVPRAFRVARSPRGRVVAFTILCELADVPQRLLAERPALRPVAARTCARTRSPRGQQVLLARQALAHGHRRRAVALLRRAAARPRARVAGGRPGAAAHLLARARRRAARAARADRVRRAAGLPRGRARRRVPPDPARPRPGVGGGLAVRARRARPARAGHAARRATRASSCSTAAGSRSPSSSAT